MSETIEQMENRWAVAISARYGLEHPRFPRERITDRDPKYAQECAALRVEIEKRKEAEAARPQINHDQLSWLNRLQGATDKDGKRLAADPTPRGTKLRENLERARIRAYSGEDISEMIASTERDLTAQGIQLGSTLPEPTQRFMPPASATGPQGAGAINTQRGPA